MSRGLLAETEDLVPVLLIAGAGLVLLVPDANGSSLLQKLGGSLGAVNAGAGAVGQVSGNVGGIIGGIIGTGGAPNQPGPANASSDSFNINTDGSVSWARAIAGGAFGAVLSGAHVGIGHIGGGGAFSCRLWARTGGLFGLGASQSVKLGEQQFSVNADSAWSGYGIDFGTTPIAGPGGGWFGPGSVNVWADIVDQNGNLYTQANIAVASV